MSKLERIEIPQPEALFSPDTHKLLKEFDREILKNYQGNDLEKIFRAKDLMLKIHANQPRLDGFQYVYHTTSVGLRVARILKDPDADLVITGLLHDIVEDHADKLARESLINKGENDQTITNKLKVMSKPHIELNALEYIRENYGQEVRDSVRDVTNPDFVLQLKEQGKQQTDVNYNKAYSEHVRLIIKNPRRLPVKYCDNEDNVLGTDANPSALGLFRIKDKQKIFELMEKYGPGLRSYLASFKDEDNSRLIAPDKKKIIIHKIETAQYIIKKQLQEWRDRKGVR